ncbi:MAG: hypothetical protein ACLFNZ_01975 [Spirochaetaceae bacterium]
MPGVIHYMKSLFTRYQLVAELFQAECEAAAETADPAGQAEPSGQAEAAGPRWLSSLRLIARESAEAYRGEVEPFVLLLDTLYTSAEVIEKKFPLDSSRASKLRAVKDFRKTPDLCSGTDFFEPAASILMEIIKISAAFIGGHIVIAPRAAELPRNCCCRMLGPLSAAVYLMLREGGKERVEIGIHDDGGTPWLSISSEADLHKTTPENLKDCGCIRTGVDAAGKTSCIPSHVSGRYTCKRGAGTLRLLLYRRHLTADKGG